MATVDGAGCVVPFLPGHDLSMHEPASKRWLEFLLLLLTAAGGCAEAVAPASASCDVRVEHEQVHPRYYERVDLLFVLDDSPSMAQERRHFLDVQLPRATQLLLGSEAQDSLQFRINLHVGVISSDMGAGAAGMVDGCSASGDGGRLLNGGKCQASEPEFAWFYEGRDDRDATRSAVACLADVGNAGCQVSQPLEAALTALSPGPDANARFLRSEAPPSMVLVVILTDQDDCSTHDPTTFGGEAPGPTAALGCIRDPSKLRAIQTYVSGLRALRPDVESLLNVGIIAGVPPEWVSSVLAPAREHAAHPTLLRDAFEALLADSRMQPDANGGVASCSSATATATAPRRLMQFARELGPDAHVQSICDYDLADMLRQMLEFIRPTYGGSALNTRMPMLPDAHGLLPCRVTWELPEHADPEEPLTPVSCAERPDILGEPGPGFPRRSEQGRVLCELRQAPVVASADGPLQPQGEGFFSAPDERCPSKQVAHRIGFTERAQIPPGVTTRIECLDSTQRAPALLPGGPAIGDACSDAESRCSSHPRCGNLAGDHGPGKLFCSSETNRCVLGCQDDAQCPEDWVCDAASRICVRPGCE